jgi:rhodanese-related sulfurtransferase
MALKRGIKALVDEAMADVETWNVDQAMKAHGKDEYVFVDIRDPRELWRDGTIPGAFHAPRGMIEFWVDPDSPYAKKEFQDPSKKYVFFCAAGWRSALTTKTVKDMGMENVAHFEGGFGDWVKKGGPVQKVEAPTPKK